MLVSMLQAYTPERVLELMEHSRAEGADAFGMQFCRMKKEYRTRETYERLFAAAGEYPVYVTNYRQGENALKSDEQLARELCELAECGATLCDVMGDYFERTEGEMTYSERAIEKQMALIEQIHSAGAEVVMSSHVLKFIPAEQVLAIALEHQRRGADICKIVTGASNMEEQIKAGVELPKFYMCCGTEDFLYQVNVKFHKQFEGRIDLTYFEEPGTHEWGFWDRNIQRILEWLPLEKKEAL